MQYHQGLCRAQSPAMRRYIFADEAGDFEFAKKKNVSRYFIACVVSMDSCDVGVELLKLRRDMLWDDVPVGEYFHACEDKQAVRDKVFELLAQHDFKIHAQIMEKSKAQPQIRESHHRFYQHCWLYLFRHAAPKIMAGGMPDLMVTAASIGTKKGQLAFSEAVKDVLTQTMKIRAKSWKTTFCPAMSDPCLQVADYCAWAIQRKWERGDLRSYDLIKSKIVYEYDLWQRGTTHYY